MPEVIKKAQPCMFKYVPPVVDESTAAAAVAAAEAQDAKELEEAAGEADSADAAGGNGTSLSAGVAGAVVSVDADGEAKKRKRIQPTSIASLDAAGSSSTDGVSALPTPPQNASDGAAVVTSSASTETTLTSATAVKIKKRIAPQLLPADTTSATPAATAATIGLNEAVSSVADGNTADAPMEIDCAEQC